MPRPSPSRCKDLTFGFVAVLMLSALAESPAQAAPAHPEALPARVTAQDGLVLLSYPVREGVRGNDDNVHIDLGSRGGHDRRTVIRGRWDHRDVMDEGPAWLLCEVKHGEVRSLDVAVGQGRRLRARADRELGEVDGGEVAAWLLGLVRGSGPAKPGQAAEDPHPTSPLDEDEAGTAIMAAVIARDADCGPELLAMLDDRRLDPEIRSDAMMWAVHVAGAKLIERAGAMVDDPDEDLEVRETAVVALAQAEDAVALDRLLTIARGHAEPSLRHTALVMLARHGEDPRVTALLEEIILGE